MKPALHNKNSVRTVAIVTTTALAARGSLLAPGNIAKVLKPEEREPLSFFGVLACVPTEHAMFLTLPWLRYKRFKARTVLCRSAF